MSRFEHGNKAAAGIARPNAGRPPDWLKRKCQAIVSRKKLLEFLGNVASGEDIEQVVTEDGVTIQIPAPIKERLKAVEILLNRGYGKVDSDAPTTPADSVVRAEQAARLLKELESYSINNAPKVPS